jgi:peptidoglycan hydrolase CwlO-like protein
MNAKLLSQIHDNLSPLDTDELYADMLDDCYGEVEIAGISFSTSRALKELDPTAYRCGECDYIDSLSLVEIHGDYYEQDAVEAERDSLVTDLENELSDLEDELLENEKDIKNETISEEAGNAESEELQDKIAKLTAEIQEIKDYCF